MMNRYSEAGRFLLCPQPRPSAKLRLVCFPFAGGGASAFFSWPQKLAPEIEVCCVQLPGRENRVAEKPATRLAEVVPGVVDALRPLAEGPYAFFGHSMGALIAFEAARMLRREHGTEPLVLIASAHRAPQQPPKDRPLHDLPKDQLIEEMRRFNGTPEEVLQNGELMELLLPVVRADFSICETYEYREGPPLGCEIRAVGGMEDEVSRDDLAAWRCQTTGRFALRMFPGGHFYFYRDPLPLLTWMTEVLAALPCVA